MLLALTFSFLHRFVPLFLPFLLLLLHAVHFLLLFLTTLAANALMAEEDKKAADGHSANTAKYSLKHTRRRTLFSQNQLQSTLKCLSQLFVFVFVYSNDLAEKDAASVLTYFVSFGVLHFLPALSLSLSLSSFPKTAKTQTCNGTNSN